MIIIGERLNSSRRRVLEAFRNHDEKYLVDQAVKQARAGASYIDINAAAMIEEEIATLRWVIPLLQGAVRVPIAIDTPNPEAIEAGLDVHAGRALLNSLPGDARSLETLMPLIRKFRPQVIALCLAEGGPPADADIAAARAEKIAGILAGAGIGLADFFIDPLVRPVSGNPKSAVLFLDSLKKTKARLPGVKIVAGLSNVSFGLPRRRLLNRTFLSLALAGGLDAAICDPLDDELQATLDAARALLGQDPSLQGYLRHYKPRSKARADGPYP